MRNILSINCAQTYPDAYPYRWYCHGLKCIMKHGDSISYAKHHQQKTKKDLSDGRTAGIQEIKRHFIKKCKSEYSLFKRNAFLKFPLRDRLSSKQTQSQIIKCIRSTRMRDHRKTENGLKRHQAIPTF